MEENKIKLIRLSANSWHNRLMRFVLKKNAPGPHNMYNLCPYFWLLMFCIFASPFVLLFKTIGFIIKNTLGLLSKYISRAIYNGFINSLSVIRAGNLKEYNEDVPAHIFKDRWTILSDWMERHYNMKLDSKEGKEKMKEIIEERRRIRSEQATKRYEEKLKKEERNRQFEKNMDFINEKFDSLISSIRKMFTFNFDYSNIIKYTKKVLGIIVTLFMCVCVYYFVNLISLLVLLIIDVWNGPAVLHAIIVLCCLIAAVAATLFLIFSISQLFNYVKNNYSRGKKLFVIEVLKYVILYPLYYVVALPLYFIFVKFLWGLIIYRVIYKLILVSVGKFFAFLFNSIVSSTGIFGQYFKSSYSDFCPGIEWVEE